MKKLVLFALATFAVTAASITQRAQAYYYRSGDHISIVGDKALPEFAPAVAEDGPITGCSASPKLPEGLVLSDACVLSGATHQKTPKTEYLFSAEQNGKPLELSLYITVFKEDPAEDGPRELKYSRNPVRYRRAKSISPNVPSFKGEIETFSIRPPLPNGLNLDPESGILWGTPEKVADETSYVITGKGPGGSTSVTLDLAVDDVAPRNLTYKFQHPTYYQGVMIEPNLPKVEGGIVTEYSVRPALPKGLTLDYKTGMISGTPIQSPHDPHYFTVVAKNDFGSTDTTLQIGIINNPIYWAVMNPEGGPHTAIPEVTMWTGEKALIWDGGRNGALYDPLTNKWSPMSMENGPGTRSNYTWTRAAGTKILVWGGINAQAGKLNTGAIYDSRTNSWKSISTVGAPSPRYGASAVWAGDRVIVAGGYDVHGNYANGGAIYDLAKDQWTTPPGLKKGGPFAFSEAYAVWTGSEMLIWGGRSERYQNHGALYNPATDTWKYISANGAPAPRLDFSAAWTGSELVIWGGKSWDRDRTITRDDGFRYNPKTDKWTALPKDGSPGARSGHTGIWTGKEYIVWGGVGPRGYLGDGMAYIPATDQWKPLPTSPATPAPRTHHAAVWGHKIMFIWGGTGGEASTLWTGAMFQPEE